MKMEGAYCPEEEEQWETKKDSALEGRTHSLIAEFQQRQQSEKRLGYM